MEDVSEDGGRRTEDVDLIPNLLGHLDELFLGAVRNSFGVPFQTNRSLNYCDYTENLL